MWHIDKISMLLQGSGATNCTLTFFNISLICFLLARNSYENTMQMKSRKYPFSQAEATLGTRSRDNKDPVSQANAFTDYEKGGVFIEEKNETCKLRYADFFTRCFSCRMQQ